MIGKKPSFLESSEERTAGADVGFMPERERGYVGQLSQVPRPQTAPLLQRLAELELRVETMAKQREAENQQLAEFVQDILRRLNAVESQIGG